MPTRPHHKGVDGCLAARSCMPQGRRLLPADGQVGYSTPLRARGAAHFACHARRQLSHAPGYAVNATVVPSRWLRWPQAARAVVSKTVCVFLLSVCICSSEPPKASSRHGGYKAQVIAPAGNERGIRHRAKTARCHLIKSRLSRCLANPPKNVPSGRSQVRRLRRAEIQQTKRRNHDHTHHRHHQQRRVFPLHPRGSPKSRFEN